MARGVGKKSDAARPPPQAWLANCLHPGARVVTAKDVVLAPVADHAGAEKEKKPRGGGRPRGAAPGGEPVDYAAHEVVPPPEGWRREVIPRKSVQGVNLLDVADGAAHVREGGDGRVKLDVTALAPLYSGFLSGETLALAGRVAGSADELALASAVFAAPAPTMLDKF